mmetsp:Transcript_114672/g.356150  ORF Transcript_114672/g.356150 Transcript_114672/m.356150 type:complete len:238 (-) Transcript_114672:491-1204(-)
MCLRTGAPLIRGILARDIRAAGLRPLPVPPGPRQPPQPCRWLQRWPWRRRQRTATTESGPSIQRRWWLQAEDPGRCDVLVIVRGRLGDRREHDAKHGLLRRRTPRRGWSAGYDGPLCAHEGGGWLWRLSSGADPCPLARNTSGTSTGAHGGVPATGRGPRWASLQPFSELPKLCAHGVSGDSAAAATTTLSTGVGAACGHTAAATVTASQGIRLHDPASARAAAASIGVATTCGSAG